VLSIVSGSRLVTANTPGITRFNGVTPALTAILWTDAAGDVILASRTDTMSDYGIPEKIGATISSPGGKAALAPSANEVVVVSGTTLVAYERAGEGAPWTGPNAKSLAPINDWIAAQGGSPAEPVIGASGKTLFFLRTPASGAPELCESSWDGAGAAWGKPEVHTSADLASTDATKRRRPTGVGSDDRTLFFFDEVAGIERSATRDLAAGEFTAFADVGDYKDAVPNDGCGLVYYFGSDAKGLGIFNTGGPL
jgi:hypothetical protein